VPNCSELFPAHRRQAWEAQPWRVRGTTEAKAWRHGLGLQNPSRLPSPTVANRKPIFSGFYPTGWAIPPSPPEYEKNRKYSKPMQLNQNNRKAWRRFAPPGYTYRSLQSYLAELIKPPATSHNVTVTHPPFHHPRTATGRQRSLLLKHNLPLKRHSPTHTIPPTTSPTMKNESDGSKPYERSETLPTRLSLSTTQLLQTWCA
jgi:hypothetical protein